jgi:hypothetical protein
MWKPDFYDRVGPHANPLYLRCEALALLRHTYLRSFVLDPEDVGSVSLGTFWNFSKRTGLP